jgi:hypothetical protein
MLSMNRLTKNQKLFIECLNSNGDQLLKRSWLTRGEILTANSLVKRGLIYLNTSWK